MTTEQLKKIVDSGDYCIQCPRNYISNEMWREYVKSIHDGFTGFNYCKYYSPKAFVNKSHINDTPESKTVLTLDQWWSVVNGEESERKLYTIQDLADGKVACVNDGTVEELRRLFDASGGKWFHGKQLNGRGKYYYIEHDNEIFADLDKPNLPTQSVKDFVKQLEVKECKHPLEFRDGHVCLNCRQHGIYTTSEQPTEWQPQPGEMVEAYWHQTTKDTNTEVSIGQCEYGAQHIKEII